MTVRLRKGLAALSLLASALLSSGCGNPIDPSIVYHKPTPEEFAAMSPEDQELPEVRELMGADWKDPNLPENAPNPRRRGRRR